MPGLREGLRGLAIVLVLNVVVFGVVWLNRPEAPPVQMQATPTPVVDSVAPVLEPAPDALVAAVAGLRSADPEALDAARRLLGVQAPGRAAALLEGLADGCYPELAQRIELLAYAGGLTTAEAGALAWAAVGAALESDGRCAADTAAALMALYRSTALDGGAAVRQARRLLAGLAPGDGVAVPLVSLVDVAAPEESGWPAILEGWALDERLHVQARAAACRAVVRRRVPPDRLLEQRLTLPGPLQRCLLLPTVQDRSRSALALLGSDDIDTRLEAIAALHGSGEPEDVVPLLVRLRADIGPREHAALIEAAGYLVQLNMEWADDLVPTDAPPDSPEAAVRARAEAGAPTPPTPEQTWCDGWADAAIGLDASVRLAGSRARGGRLCLPDGSTWSGDVTVADSEVTLVALGTARLEGTLRLAVPSVVIGLRADAVEACPGSILLWAGSAADAVVVDEGIHVPPEAVGLWRAWDGVLGSDGRVDPAALSWLSSPERFDRTPSQGPVGWTPAGDVSLPPPPSLAIGSERLPAMKPAKRSFLIPLRGADFVPWGDAIVVGVPDPSPTTLP